MNLLESQFVLINDLESKFLSFFDDVSGLEYEVSRLSDDLDIQADQIKFLEEKICLNES